MPKQIKKILFHQISMFLGLAIIIAFSSIFGAILLHQALAVPSGTGSVITAVNNLATALTDIKGDGFVKNTHSLKQIKDQVNTVETKIDAGFKKTLQCGITTQFSTGLMGGIEGADAICAGNFAQGWKFATFDKWMQIPLPIDTRNPWIKSAISNCANWMTGVSSQIGEYLENRDIGLLQSPFFVWGQQDVATCDTPKPLICCNY